MKTTCLALIIALSSSGVLAFVPSQMSHYSTAVHGYVPDGFSSAEEYQKFRKKEEDQKKKNLGRLGPRGFQSRSFESFHKALERGETSHLLPVFDAKGKLKRGEIRKEDIPYMQRGGNWDNSDVKGARKMKWLDSDKSYANGGFKKEQSVSIFGYGEGLDWTGSKARKGAAPGSMQITAPTFGKNYKAPNVLNDIKKNQKDDPKKKGGFFGLF